MEDKVVVTTESTAMAQNRFFKQNVVTKIDEPTVKHASHSGIPDTTFQCKHIQQSACFVAYCP